jgi:hypothetical protein
MRKGGQGIASQALLTLIHRSARNWNSRKFICRIVHRSPLKGARMAPKRLHAACQGVYMLWCWMDMRCGA